MLATRFAPPGLHSVAGLMPNVFIAEKLFQHFCNVSAPAVITHRRRGRGLNATPHSLEGFPAIPPTVGDPSATLLLAMQPVALAAPPHRYPSIKDNSQIVAIVN
jgi:hypothetical protein